MFLAGTYDTNVRLLVKLKIDEWTFLYKCVYVYIYIYIYIFVFPLRNNAGIAGLFFLSVPNAFTFLVKRKISSSNLVKKLSLVTPLPVPDM